MIKASSTSWLDTRICYHSTSSWRKWQSYCTCLHFYPAASPQCSHWIQRQSRKYWRQYRRFRCLQSQPWLHRGSGEDLKQPEGLIQTAVFNPHKSLDKMLDRLCRDVLLCQKRLQHGCLGSLHTVVLRGKVRDCSLLQDLPLCSIYYFFCRFSQLRW